MPELDDTLYQKILRLSQHADSKLERAEYRDAARMYLEALHLLPAPMEQWEAATWLSGSAANTLFFAQRFADAARELRRTLRMPDALGNPFVHPRYGQALHEVGSVEEAKQELLKAYMLEGTHILENENPKYLELIQDII